MKVCGYVLRAVYDEGIRHAFLVPGGLIDPFLTAFKGAGVEGIVAAHEAGAGFMADGYGRSSSKFGVCLAIGGPGAANLVPLLRPPRWTTLPFWQSLDSRDWCCWSGRVSGRQRRRPERH